MATGVAVTVTVTEDDVEGVKFDVPPKLAVIESAPAGSVFRLILAVPLLLSVPVPMDVPPSRKVTMPLVAGLPLLFTMAVSVTEAPAAAVAVDAVSVVAVVATDVVTVTVTTFEAEAAKLDVPPKLAMRASAPTGRVDRLILAVPLLTGTAPTVAPLLKNVTVPLVTGTPLATTAAVKLTADPETGLRDEVLSVVVVDVAATVTVTAVETEAAKLEPPP
jgi:hypothetical protein